MASQITSRSGKYIIVETEDAAGGSAPMGKLTAVFWIPMVGRVVGFFRGRQGNQP